MPADRIAECHGNPSTSELNLAMAGNQWVAFNKVMQAFNARRVAMGDSDVGPVWVSELQLAVNNGDAVSGLQMSDSVNFPVVYSVAFLETMNKRHRDLASDFVKFLLTDATAIYVDGGFSALTGSEMGERYSIDKDGTLQIETFLP